MTEKLEKNGNGKWQRTLMIITIIVTTIGLFTSIAYQVGEKVNQKADKVDLACVKQELIQRDQDIKTDFLKRTETNFDLVKKLSDKIDDNNKLLSEIKGQIKASTIRGN